jgi:hypothetical protein
MAISANAVGTASDPLVNWVQLTAHVPFIVGTFSTSYPFENADHWLGEVVYTDSLSSFDDISDYVAGIVVVGRTTGAAGGDPHIEPFTDEERHVHMLPTTNKCYTLYDNRNINERIIINAEMWMLSARLLHLAKFNSAYKPLISKTCESKTSKPNPDSTSFMRRISVCYINSQNSRKSQYAVFDLEDLLKGDRCRHGAIQWGDFVSSPDVDIRVRGKKHIRSSQTMLQRFVNIQTESLRVLLTLIIMPDAVGHRNHVTLTTNNTNGATGLLIDVTCDNEVDSLENVSEISRSIFTKPLAKPFPHWDASSWATNSARGRKIYL